MRNFLNRFMLGRYGPDHLGVAMIIVSFILSLIYAVTGYMPPLYISYIMFGLVLFRMLSRNIVRRRAENDKFIKYWWPIRTKIKRIINKLKQKRTHKLFTCPGCKKKLRVPRGKGKLQISCPMCGEKFFRKT